MGNGTATTYFQELKKLAKLVGRRRDEDERGVLVKAVRLGVSESYTKFIAFLGHRVPQTYTQWKARIIAMHKERQKKWAFDQVTGSGFCNSHPPLKGSSTTATSHAKAGGVTSSTTAKPTSSAPPQDRQGRWQLVKMTTYHGVGEPMDISMLRREGKCFRCHKKGHLSKDCLDKKEYKDIRLLYTAKQAKTEEKTELKIKEVKETAV
ncbi:hypothetical protein ARMSODRAFT_1017840 [Armillaria solidipes]|uniref:CCHC-type domain-containing protein n=1 Tax=Armillaria solidipes TaxID=1076256 RepID=A0A2H3BHI1_9AGAR|nr:hypothetical protein ARMSODRAFT_1017840 [Armillaria solidipes]